MKISDRETIYFINTNLVLPIRAYTNWVCSWASRWHHRLSLLSAEGTGHPWMQACSHRCPGSGDAARHNVSVPTPPCQESHYHVWRPQDPNTVCITPALHLSTHVSLSLGISWWGGGGPQLAKKRDSRRREKCREEGRRELSLNNNKHFIFHWNFICHHHTTWVHDIPNTC